MGFIDKIKSLFSSSGSANEVMKPTPYTNSITDLNTVQDINSKVDEDSVVDKAKEFIAGTVDEVKEQGTQLWNEVKEKAGELNEATKEYREQIVEKAKDALEKIDEFVDKTVEKADKLKEDERLKDLDQDGFADKPIDFGKSDSKEDFFNKAEKWLEKNESQTKTTNDSDDSTRTNHDKLIQPIELPKDPV
jgi:hypothetical protein